MTIIEQLRQQIEQVLCTFIASHQPLSAERLNNINQIRQMLTHSNPLKLKLRLAHYVNNLSTGFESWFPFLQVNRLKSELKIILDLPKYQENKILKSMMTEMGIHLSQDDIAEVPTDGNVLRRLENLEKLIQSQTRELSTLHQELTRLKIENQFLTQTIGMLSNNNELLEKDNQQLQKEKQGLEKEVVQLKSEYAFLLAENEALKSKMRLALQEPTKTPAPQPIHAAKTISSTAKSLPSATCRTESFSSIFNSGSESIRMPRHSFSDITVSLRKKI